MTSISTRINRRRGKKNVGRRGSRKKKKKTMALKKKERGVL